MKLLKKIGSNKLTPIFAALCVVLATLSGYLASQVSGDSTACTVRREIIIRFGSETFASSREAIGAVYSASIYNELSNDSISIDDKRHFAYLATKYANDSIFYQSEIDGLPKMSLWKFPQDVDVMSNKFHFEFERKLDFLSKRQLMSTARRFDERIAGDNAMFGGCAAGDFASALASFVAVFLTIASILLIGVREYSESE